MPNYSTTLPTEPGTYLFCGVRETRDLTLMTLAMHHPRVELVHVYQKPNGKLSFVGRDFFYHPEEVKGMWLCLTEEATALQAKADTILLDAVARTDVPKACTDSWWGNTRESIARTLAGPFPNFLPVAGALFDRAVELGTIIKDPQREGTWKPAEIKEKP